MTPSLAVVIVSYNCGQALRACLRSCQTIEGPARLVVVDNASVDGTAAMVRREFPGVAFLGNSGNRGFAAACNQGLAVTTEEHVLLLNPDTVVNTAAIGRLLAVMRDVPEVGAVGPRVVNPDGSLQRSCRRFPTLATMVGAELGWRRHYRMWGWSHDDTREVDQLIGCCLLLRRQALRQVGPLDERFFLYFEEVDLCLRLVQAGWKVLFVHDAQIIHVKGESSKSVRVQALEWRYRSLAAFFRKHYPDWHLRLLKGAIELGAWRRVLLGQRDYLAVVRMAWRL